MGDNRVIVCVGESGDWEGVYVNNELFVEDHRLHSMHWTKLIEQYNVFSSNVRNFEISDEYLENMGNFPVQFTDIPNGYKFEV